MRLWNEVKQVINTHPVLPIALGVVVGVIGAPLVILLVWAIAWWSEFLPWPWE